MLENNAIPSGAAYIIKTLLDHGAQAYLVGGCVRDLLLGKTPKEWDITTSAPPKEVSKLFTKVIPTGIKYGTVTVLLDDGQYEVTTFRCDEKYVDGRHPSNVKFTDDIHQDLSRRDFTINAMAYNPSTNELIDDHAGKIDLEKKIIRTVGQPIDRFNEDGLRSIRACRFAATLNFNIEKETFEAIGKTLKVTKKVAPERIRDELIKMLAADKPSIGFELMRQGGLLALFMPELVACYGVDQPPQYHKYDVYWHSLYACDAAPKDNLILRLAALLHDIAKPKCKKDYTYYNHDIVGMKMAQKILKHLHFSSSDTNKIVNLIGNHMFNYTASWGDAAVRRLLVRLGGAENAKDLFALRQADTKGMEREIESDYLRELQGRIDKIVAEENALHVKDLKISGKDVMQALKIKPGPEVGKVLQALLEKVLDDPSLNNREALITLIKSHA
ncbi:MAG: CCA tRNA nucleotidyltransferase [Candidatus Margulisiibacteriota bacterium]